VDGITDGNGLDWMISAFGNTVIEHGYHTDGHSDTLPFIGNNLGPQIRLDQNWMTDLWGPKVLFAHELGHVWDINTGFAASYHLDLELGGRSWLLGAPVDGVPRWPSYYHQIPDGDSYGNTRRNEYFAEAFAATIYNPNDAPIGVTSLIDEQISNSWYILPWR
jgi:hypothetical protein